MTQQEKYLHRAAQGATLAPGTVITEPTIEQVVTAYQEHFYPNPLYKIVDAYDAYLWRALADSARQAIALIEECRPRTEVQS